MESPEEEEIEQLMEMSLLCKPDEDQTCRLAIRLPGSNG